MSKKAVKNEISSEIEIKKGDENFREKFSRICGFEIEDLLSWEKFVKLMYRPTDPSSFGITRILFGMLMLSDVPEERGGSELDIRWGDPRDCHFPLFNFLRPLPLPYMGLLYGVMWLGALGVMLGYKFRLSMGAFIVPYFYIFLLDKSFWNNHSYLFGIVSILLLGSSANHYWSVDGILNPKIKDKHVPLWNYFILKYQFFLLYFLAGLKKADFEWLDGYAMSRLGYHWVFDPFKILLTPEQIDYLIVHWFGFLLDLTIGFWLLYDVTRPVAMIFCAAFHIMNTRLFSIGMFPYVCLATMPLFCENNWPRKFYHFVTRTKMAEPGPSQACIYDKSIKEKCDNNQKTDLETKITWKHSLVTILLLSHCGLQLFLPYSHFITEGYNNWTQGLYGYSWDMMVHAWDSVLVVVKVVDNKTGREHFLDPSAWTSHGNMRWTRHADMCVQYAQCLKRNLVNELESTQQDPIGYPSQDSITSEDISIYIDVWCSLNHRFQQRMFNPNYDLLKANWSPFKKVEWLIPLFTEYSNWRTKLIEIQNEVYSWSNYSDVLFVADFPGLYLENYITDEMSNVTLTVLEGEVFYEVENSRRRQSNGIKLSKGASTSVKSRKFHKVHTISKVPACYMYTYINATKMTLKESLEPSLEASKLQRSPFPFLEEIPIRFDRISKTLGLIGNSFLNVLYNVPMIRRSRVH